MKDQCCMDLSTDSQCPLADQEVMCIMYLKDAFDVEY